MIKIEVGGIKYTVPFITARAIRLIEPMEKLIEKVSQGERLTGEDVETMAQWMCVLFDYQFSMEDLLDGYPADRFTEDVFACYVAVQNGLTHQLRLFPDTGEERERDKKKDAPPFGR
ncbi:MAG: hypothetical protein GX786_04880, partial [Clostridiales bacterium]|nr:hypothetical protein [Clostridiales bacterium]